MRHSLVGTLRLSRDAVAANKPEFAFSILKLPDYGQNSCLYPRKHTYRVTVVIRYTKGKLFQLNHTHIPSLRNFVNKTKPVILTFKTDIGLILFDLKLFF